MHDDYKSQGVRQQGPPMMPASNVPSTCDWEQSFNRTGQRRLPSNDERASILCRVSSVSSRIELRMIRMFGAWGWFKGANVGVHGNPSSQLSHVFVSPNYLHELLAQLAHSCELTVCSQLLAPPNSLHKFLRLYATNAVAFSFRIPSRWRNGYGYVQRKTENVSSLSCVFITNQKII